MIKSVKLSPSSGNAPHETLSITNNDSPVITLVPVNMAKESRVYMVDIIDVVVLRVFVCLSAFTHRCTLCRSDPPEAFILCTSYSIPLSLSVLS